MSAIADLIEAALVELFSYQKGVTAFESALSTAYEQRDGDPMEAPGIESVETLADHGVIGASGTQGVVLRLNTTEHGPIDVALVLALRPVK